MDQSYCDREFVAWLRFIFHDKEPFVKLYPTSTCIPEELKNYGYVEGSWADPLASLGPPDFDNARSDDAAIDPIASPACTTTTEDYRVPSEVYGRYNMDKEENALMYENVFDNNQYNMDIACWNDVDGDATLECRMWVELKPCLVQDNSLKFGWGISRDDNNMYDFAMFEVDL